MKNFNKYLLGLALVVVFGAYVLHDKTRSDDVLAGDETGTEDIGGGGGTSAGSETINPNGGSKGTTGGTDSAGPAAGTYRDGIYTGRVTDAFYGNYQVAAVISGGKLTDVKFLMYPNDRHESTEINEQAIPILKSEAIRAQSANVDIVSGATQSAEAFRESLASALAQAS